MNKNYYTNNYMLNVIVAINKCAPYATTKTAYAMLQVRKKFQDELAPFEEARQQLFERFGEKSKDGQITVIKEGNEENYEKFTKELTDLLNIGLEVETYSIPEEAFDLKFEGDVTLYDYDLIHAVICDNGR